jgi:hypothetical protein
MALQVFEGGYAANRIVQVNLRWLPDNLKAKKRQEKK